MVNGVIRPENQADFYPVFHKKCLGSSYEQYESKLPFVFRRTLSKIYLFFVFRKQNP